MTTSVVCNRRLSTGRRGGQLQLASAPYRQSISCHFLGGMRWLATSTWWAQSSQIGHVFYHGRDGHATKPSWHAPLLNQSPGRRTAHSLFRVDFKSAIANPQSAIRNRQSFGFFAGGGCDSFWGSSGFLRLSSLRDLSFRASSIASRCSFCLSSTNFRTLRRESFNSCVSSVSLSGVLITCGEI